jgi:hypothetical protein
VSDLLIRFALSADVPPEVDPSGRGRPPNSDAYAVDRRADLAGRAPSKWPDGGRYDVA